MRLLILILAFSVQWALGQSLKDDLDRMYKVYENQSDLYAKIESVVYEDGNEKMTKKMTIKKKGGQYLYEMEEQSMLINDKYLVVVDHRNKQISYDKWSEHQANMLAKMYIPLGKDLLEKYPKTEYRGEKSGIRQYSLYNDKVQMSRLDIFFDTKTGLVSQTRHYYNPKLVKNNVYIDMHFKEVDTQPNLSDNAFSEKQFLNITSKGVTAIDKYKTYKLQAALSFQ
ncbi:LolA family protein [Aureispira anguillae]|uniref:Uncharacterized protein n=1 Tax=Aureispira anguillae TaxID=2864201 RepID=A0A916DW00_9BACT|nr:hypothetical protein [Aureispira anguillae]BDS15669.1 hypothetical protein AsAng_0064530 [Aureispira anguillae]